MLARHAVYTLEVPPERSAGPSSQLGAGMGVNDKDPPYFSCCTFGKQGLSLNGLKVLSYPGRHSMTVRRLSSHLKRLL